MSADLNWSSRKRPLPDRKPEEARLRLLGADHGLRWTGHARRRPQNRWKPMVNPGNFVGFDPFFKGLKWF